MDYILRQIYLSSIERYIGKGLIIVLVGQRRVGKSCLLAQLRHIKQADSHNHIIYIDKEKREFDFIRTYQDLNDYIAAHYQQGKKNYILIDEVQDIAEFERSLRSYYSEPDAQVIITGSNAHILSSELSTLIGGRYKEIYVQSLSYAEFIELHGLQDNDDTLALYVNYGGMPGLARIGLDLEIARGYLKDIYHTVLLKDVVMRNQIRNATFLENLVSYLADNTGKLISANNISKYMKTQGVKITPTAIIHYLRCLSQAYIVQPVRRYDIHGKRLFENNEKYYFEDHGIRNALAGSNRSGDIEKVLENMVFQHLIRLGYTVTVGQLQAGEIDFVCTKPSGQRRYVQVTYLVADETTRKREFGNLSAIKDDYPKYVISMSPLVTRNDDNGITHLGIRRFLLERLE